LDWTCCWHKDVIAPEECPYIEEGEEYLYAAQQRRILEKCLECPRFTVDIQRMRESGEQLAPLFSVLTNEFLDMRIRLQSMDGFLNSKTREIRFLHELNTVLQTSMDLDEILSVAMTAITAGKGFGMNRAFLLMCDKEQQYLRGYLGVGPRTYDEAWHIWEEVSRNDLSLKEMARQFQINKLSFEKVKFHDILERLTIPLSDQDHILNRALREKRPIMVEDAFHNPQVNFQFAQTLGVDSFLVMPLVSSNRRIGVIIADNCITHRPITQQDIQSLETFAFPVGFALVRASLYERLQEEVDKLTVANRKLQEQQELIVKMEKMALVGRITSSIAHSIRNPLMVIGGFARSLLKDVTVDDPKKEYLGSIVQEARQLEDVLEEILNYSESLYPVKDRWDINQVVTGICRELQDRFEAEQCGCQMELANELPMLFIDYKQISYCIRTILSSALDHRVRGGKIVVRTWHERDAVIVCVEDRFSTLTASLWESLVTPFAETQELGVGVGLPLCRTILEKSGHRLLLENLPEGGIRYIIQLLQHKEE